MASKSIKIDHNTIVKEFSNHLDIKDNDRILFTAPYGAGKSTFLQEVFEKSESYFAIKLFPVNYSVAINEDVFELIKFDLLMQLMGHYNEEIDLRKEDFTFLLRSQFFIMERMRFMPLLYALIGLSDKVGQPVTDLIKAIESTGENFENFSKEIKADETKIITQYLNSIENTKGNIHESDAISQLIYDLIDRVKKNRNKPEELEVKSVLIIDDLDRLDPEHGYSGEYDHLNDEILDKVFRRKLSM